MNKYLLLNVTPSCAIKDNHYSFYVHINKVLINTSYARTVRFLANTSISSSHQNKAIKSLYIVYRTYHLLFLGDDRMWLYWIVLSLLSYLLLLCANKSFPGEYVHAVTCAIKDDRHSFYFHITKVLIHLMHEQILSWRTRPCSIPRHWIWRWRRCPPCRLCGRWNISTTAAAPSVTGRRTSPRCRNMRSTSRCNMAKIACYNT